MITEIKDFVKKLIQDTNVDRVTWEAHFTYFVLDGGVFSYVSISDVFDSRISVQDKTGHLTDLRIGYWWWVKLLWACRRQKKRIIKAARRQELLDILFEENRVAHLVKSCCLVSPVNTSRNKEFQT